MNIEATKKEKEYYENIVRIMLKTRGSRFNAAEYLRFQEKFSIFTISILSVFVLAWSVLLVAAPALLSAQEVQIVGALAIVASVSILVLTLLDYTQGRALRADRLQQNALTISELLRAMERELCSSGCDVAKLRKLAEKYEEANSQAQINHDTAHYRKWQMENSEPQGWSGKVSFFVTNIIFSLWYSAKPLLVHIGLIAAVVGSVIWFLGNR